MAILGKENSLEISGENNWEIFSGQGEFFIFISCRQVRVDRGAGKKTWRWESRREREKNGREKRKNWENWGNSDKLRIKNEKKPTIIR